MSLSKEYFTEDFTDPNTPHDRVLVVEGKKFYVYAGHLSYCSEFFRALFYSGFKEKFEDEIEIKELAAEDFHSLLKTMDPYAQSTITADNYSIIMACSHRFLAPGAWLLGEKFILENFDTLDKIDLLKIAFEYDWNEMKTKIASFLSPPMPQALCTKTDQCNPTTVWCNTCNEYMNFKGFPLMESSFIVQNKNRIAELSTEAQAFILQTLLDRATL